MARDRLLKLGLNRDEECPEICADEYACWNLSETYNKSSYKGYLAEFTAKNISKFKIDCITRGDLVMRSCVTSFDLLNELFEYFYTFDDVKKTVYTCVDKFKLDAVKALGEVTKAASNVPRGMVKKKLAQDIKEWERHYTMVDKCLTAPIDFKNIELSNFRDNLINDVCRAAFSSFDDEKDFEKMFKKTFSIIDNFYSKKNNVWKKRFNKRFNSLVKELKLTKFEADWLGLKISDPAVYPTFFDGKIKNLVKFGICLTSGERNEEGFQWILEYLERKDGSISDFLIKSEQEKSKIDINIVDYPVLMQEKIKNVVRLIDNHEGKTPLNILLWGEPGCGKSTLVDLLQNSVPSKKFIKINDEILKQNKKILKRYMRKKDDDLVFETKASLRMNELRICAGISSCGQFVFVMDEADDILNSSQGTSDSWLTGKKDINELLEELKVPVIWITNHKENMDQSTCRRFQYSIMFERLSVAQREKVWKKQIELTKTKKLMSDIDIRSFASKYNITPGVVNIILSDLKILNPKKSDISSTLESIISNHLSLTNEKEVKDEKIANNDKYDIAGLNIKSQFSLDKIVPAIKKFERDRLNGKAKNKNLCLLFNGPPGTGKTEFVKYIAREMEKELHYIVYSDVASCWVGETEHFIHHAFDKAEKEGAILFFDEADALINSRENATHSWEITQTSEILTRMERFKGIFVASTNFLKSIDSAAMRRFQFKLEFDYLDDKGKEIFFERFFGKNIKDKDSLARIKKLAPGDFKAVRDRLAFLEDNPSDEMIVNELEQETKYKSGTNSIGFK